MLLYWLRKVVNVVERKGYSSINPSNHPSLRAAYFQSLYKSYFRISFQNNDYGKNTTLSIYTHLRIKCVMVTRKSYLLISHKKI